MALTTEEKENLVKLLRRPRKTPVFPEDYAEHYPRVTREEFTVSTSEGDARAVVFRAKDQEPGSAMNIYIHGGGFVIGYTLRDDYYAAYIASLIRGVVVALDYSTAPEHPYPAAVNECYDMALWAYGNAAFWGADGNRVSIGGFSAGANLSAVVLLKLAETKAARFSSVYMGYGPYDNVTPPGDKPGADVTDIPLDMAEGFNVAYFGGEPERAKEIYASPILAPEGLLSQFPDSLVIVAEKCSFCAEGLDFALKLARSGVKVTVRDFLGMPHAFIPQCRGDWREADDLIAGFITTNRLQ